MNNLFIDLEIIHECQDVVEKYINLMQSEIAVKLLDMNTGNGDLLIKEFNDTLDDYMHDCLGDTLDYWQQELDNAIEDQEYDLRLI
jgi:hypothetical protein